MDRRTYSIQTTLRSDRGSRSLDSGVGHEVLGREGDVGWKRGLWRALLLALLDVRG